MRSICWFYFRLKVWIGLPFGTIFPWTVSPRWRIFSDYHLSVNLCLLVLGKGMTSSADHRARPYLRIQWAVTGEKYHLLCVFAPQSVEVSKSGKCLGNWIGKKCDLSVLLCEFCWLGRCVLCSLVTHKAMERWHCHGALGGAKECWSELVVRVLHSSLIWGVNHKWKKFPIILSVLKPSSPPPPQQQQHHANGEYSLLFLLENWIY